MTDHPALDVVRWTTEPPRCEVAEYRGYKLKVRHNAGSKQQPRSIGMIDGVPVCSAVNMPKVCNLLFAKVDERCEGAKK